MEKLKVYLDTSVISHLMQEDVPEKMADTLKLWDMFKDGKYDVYLSTVTLEEVSDCPEPLGTAPAESGIRSRRFPPFPGRSSAAYQSFWH